MHHWKYHKVLWAPEEQNSLIKTHLDIMEKWRSWQGNYGEDLKVRLERLEEIEN